MIYLARSLLMETETISCVYNYKRGCSEHPWPIFLLVKLVKGMAQPGTLSYQGYLSSSRMHWKYNAVSPGLGKGLTLDVHGQNVNSVFSPDEVYGTLEWINTNKQNSKSPLSEVPPPLHSFLNRYLRIIVARRVKSLACCGVPMSLPVPACTEVLLGIKFLEAELLSQKECAF